MSTFKGMKRAAQPDIREHARAVGCFVESRRNRSGENDKALEMAAFKAVFHPEIKGKRLRKLLKPA